MAERRVIVFPPTGRGGQRVQADGEMLGTAFKVHDLAVFLERAGLEGVDELEVAESPVIEWHGVDRRSGGGHRGHREPRAPRPREGMSRWSRLGRAVALGKR